MDGCYQGLDNPPGGGRECKDPDTPWEVLMSASTTTRSATSREQMNALVDGHYRAEENGDLAAIISGFAPGAEHDVVGRPGDALYGGEQIAGFYGALLAELRIDRFEPVRRRCGADHVVDEAVLHATAVGHPFGLDG